MELSIEIFALIISATVAVATIGLNFAQRRQVKADAAGIITEAALGLVKPLEARIDDLEQCVQNLQKENAQLRERIQKLEQENENLKQENDDLKKKRLL